MELLDPAETVDWIVYSGEPPNVVAQSTTAQVSNSAGVKQTVAGGQSQITNISTQNAHASFDSSITQDASPGNDVSQTVTATVS